MNEHIERQIYEAVKAGTPKAALARQHDTSPRSIGRICERVEKRIEEQFAAPSADSDVSADAEVPVGVQVTTTKLAVQSEALPVVEPEPELFRYFVIVDDRLINITRVAVDGSEPPTSEIAEAGTKNYEDAVAAYKAGDLKAAFLAISYKHRIEAMMYGKVKVDPAMGTMQFVDGASTFNFKSSLVNRVVTAIQETGSVDHLLKFANNLAENPSRRAVEELYDFLVAGDIEITEEGMVRCFKKVRNNFTDVHTGTFDNSVGTLVSMPRFMVDDDSEVTCSQGLHVCSKAYLTHFGGDRIVAVDVHPADFVSIPKDYYSINGGQVKAKARVCKYHVVHELDYKTLQPIVVTDDVSDVDESDDE